MLRLLVLLLVSGAAIAQAGATPAPAPADPAADSAAAPPHRRPAVLPPAFPVSPLRKLMQAQLHSAARDDGSESLTAAEADAIMTRYLASIGKPVSTVQAGHP